MHLLDLGAHLDAQFGVEIGQWLVEQEDLGIADDGAPIATRWRCPPDSYFDRRRGSVMSRMRAAFSARLISGWKFLQA
jgi:hypothetical protein